MTSFEALLPIVIETAGSTWQTVEKLKLHQRLIDFFKKKPYLLVLGSTGTGKTNFLRSLSLSAGLVEAIPAFNRTASSTKEVVRINGSPFQVFDTPGQVYHQQDRLQVIREAMAKPPVRIINVVSFGYHEYLDNAGDAVQGGAPSTEFLEKHRQREIESVLEWVSIVGHRDTTKWVITVVTKADLWWPDHDSVIEYYSTGAYAEAIKKSDPSIRHAVLPYCSVIHRYYGQARLSGDFDDGSRMETNLHFLDQLVKMG